MQQWGLAWGEEVLLLRRGRVAFRARTQSPHIWHYGVCSLKALLADWKLVLTMVGAAIAGLAMIAYAFFRPAVNPEDAERKRRLHLNQIGRIAEGQVVELAEHEAVPPASRGIFGGKRHPVANNRARQLVSYSYAISGVTYHTAQDITGLESQVRLE